MNRPLHTATDHRDDASRAAAERLSALVDGVLPAAEWGPLWQGAEADHAQVFARYEWIGQVLRQGEAAPPPADAQRIAAIMAQVRQDAAPQVPAIALQPESATPVVVAPVVAANDEVFRWKLMAGFAALAAAVSVVWNVSQLAPGAGAPQLAQAPVSAPATEPAPAAPTTLAQADAGNTAVLVQAAPGPMLRDPRLEELLAAHRQAGGMSALQMPAGFLRNATFELPGGER
jgi:sigma-E factor negative regulatory protein RseA